MPLKTKSDTKRIGVCRRPDGFYWRELIEPKSGQMGPFPTKETAKQDAHVKLPGVRLQFLEW